MKKTNSSKDEKRRDELLKNEKIQVYVTASVYGDLKELSDRTGLSVSQVAWMSFSEGYPKVRETLLKLKSGKKPSYSQPTFGN